MIKKIKEVQNKREKIIELMREGIKSKLLGILDILELEEAKDRSEAEHLFMMNQYNLYKFIDAKSECLREAIDKVRDNHIEELKRDFSHYNL